MLDPLRSSATCARVLEHAQAWLDGELPEPDAAGLRAHVATCGACARRIAVEERFLRAVRERVGLDAAPASLRARWRALAGARN